MKPSETRPTITIRLKRPLQQYIRYIMDLEFPTPIDEPLVATTNSYLGILVEPFLAYRPVQENPLLPDPKNEELFTFGLPLYDKLNTRRNTVWISEKNQRYIQRHVEYHFRLHFRTYADDKVRYAQEMRSPKGSIQKTIIQFCNDVHINFDDVSYDMLSKAYYRARKKSIKYGTVGSKRMTIGHLFFIV